MWNRTHAVCVCDPKPCRSNASIHYINLKKRMSEDKSKKNMNRAARSHSCALRCSCTFRILSNSFCCLYEMPYESFRPSTILSTDEIKRYSILKNFNIFKQIGFVCEFHFFFSLFFLFARTSITVFALGLLGLIENSCFFQLIIQWLFLNDGVYETKD